jgi:hypothetical protein
LHRKYGAATHWHVRWITSQKCRVGSELRRRRKSSVDLLFGACSQDLDLLSDGPRLYLM